MLVPPAVKERVDHQSIYRSWVNVKQKPIPLVNAPPAETFLIDLTFNTLRHNLNFTLMASICFMGMGQVSGSCHRIIEIPLGDDPAASP
jgi:hypothetical protein